MSLNEDVRVVHIGSVGVDGTGITAPEKLQITSDLAELQELVDSAQVEAIAAGKYYGSDLTGGSPAEQYNRWTLANKLFAIPVRVPVDATFDQVGLHVKAAAAIGETVRMGVYAPAADRLPGALVADLGTVSASAVAFQFTAVNLTLGRGLYWLAAAPSADIQVLADNSPGLRPIAGYASTDGTQPITVMRRSTDLASGFTSLPDPFGAMYGESGLPFFWLRAA